MVRFPYFRMIWIPAVAGIPLFCSLYGWVHAAGMKPDVAAVIVEESKGETTVKVTNTDSAPALLHTVIKEVKPAPDNSASIIIAPPVARVEGGEVQLVRIILQAPQPLSGNSGGFYCGPKPAAGDPPQRICAQFRTVEIAGLVSGQRETASGE